MTTRMFSVSPLRGEALAFIIRGAAGRLLRVALTPYGAWVASRPSGRGLRAERSLPRLAVRAFLEDET